MELHSTIVSYLKEKNFSLRPLQLDSLIHYSDLARTFTK